MGGFAGHMMHPYDNNDNTLQDLINIIKKFNKNKDIELTEKLDGLNIFVSFKDNQVVFARNKTDIKNGGFLYDEIMNRWKNVPHVLYAYQFAYIKISNLLLKYNNDGFLNTFFNKEKYQIWVNCEIIHHMAQNVIPYMKDFISIHCACAYDSNANECPLMKEERYQIYGLFNPLNNNDKYVRLTKDKKIILPYNITNKLQLFEKNITDLQNLFKSYKLNKKNTVRDFKIKAFINYVTEYNPYDLANIINIPNEELKKGLINRLVFDDKTLKIREIKNIIKNDISLNNDIIEILQNINSKKLTEIRNASLLPLKNIFMRFGFDILSNIINHENYKINNTVKECLRKYFYEIGFHENMEDMGILSIEGIVFKYKGNTYKITGTFPLYNNYNRDLNAARNIEREGLSLCGLKVAEYCKPVPRTPQLKL